MDFLKFVVFIYLSQSSNDAINGNSGTKSCSGPEQKW